MNWKVQRKERATLQAYSEHGWTDCRTIPNEPGDTITLRAGIERVVIRHGNYRQSVEADAELFDLARRVIPMTHTSGFDPDELFPRRSEDGPCVKCPHGDVPRRYWQKSGRYTADGKALWCSSARTRANRKPTR